jgi:hypothetical protein
MGSELWSHDRPAFMERVAALAGGTTYREPCGGHGTKLEYLPDAHAIATALAFARRGPQDIGPDVAYCWVLRNDAYRNRVVSLLSVALQCHELRGSDGYRTLGANAAWEAMIWDRVHDRPAGVTAALWSRIVITAGEVMATSAWDSLARAERAYTRRDQVA